MRINSLVLKQFRNIQSCELVFENNLNVLAGNNGQGKTNVIEAVVFLSSCRSFRTSDDSLLIKKGSTFGKIEARVDNKTQDNNQLKVVISESGKYLSVNQAVLGKLSEFIGHCNVVLFNPDDVYFFSQAPRKRRREIDFELGKLNSAYLTRLSLVMKLLNERNACLKAKEVDRELLQVITQQLAQASVLIIEARQKLVDQLEPRINSYYQLLSESRDVVTLDYEGCVPISDTTAEHLIRRMEDSRKRDLDTRASNVGIHRDDFVFKLNDVAVNGSLSQGQKRMLILAYKLALVDLIHEQDGQYPILCLDDLFSELDTQRRRTVLELINEDIQVFISTTDIEFIETKRSISCYWVDNGIVRKEGI